jgi:hypothetical protein
MAWIESHQSLRSHPKLFHLSNLLGKDQILMVGHLHYFWWWCVDYAPTGDLSRFSSLQIAKGAEWTGDHEKFVQALKEAGFLDATPEGFSVHDWLDFCGELVKQRCRRLKEKRRKMRHVLPSKSRHPTQPTVPNQPNPTQPTVVRSPRERKLEELEALSLTEELQSWAQREFSVQIPEDVLTEFKSYWREQTKLRSDWTATLRSRVRQLVARGILKPGRSRDVFKEWEEKHATC